jgi:hypothetical protein
VMVMFCPFGTSGRYVETGSSRVSLPSWTSWRIAVPVQVLVLLPIAHGRRASPGPRLRGPGFRRPPSSPELRRAHEYDGARGERVGEDLLQLGPQGRGQSDGDRPPRSRAVAGIRAEQ